MLTAGISRQATLVKMGWFKAGKIWVRIVGWRGVLGAGFRDDALRRNRRVSGLSPVRNNLVPEGGLNRLSINRAAEPSLALGLGVKG